MHDIDKIYVRVSIFVSCSFFIRFLFDYNRIDIEQYLNRKRKNILAFILCVIFAILVFLARIACWW